MKRERFTLPTYCGCCGEKVNLDNDRAAGMIGQFRHYRMEEMQREIDGDFEKRSVPVPPRSDS
jgi:hypothetical protein